MTTQLLVVEDDPISQDLIRSLCEARGYAVDVASDGFLGLRLLSEGRHRVVLVDYHLPEMDGYALARLMREVGGRDGAPLRLVGMTADRDGLAARRGADALFDVVLAKPLEPALLFATLERLSEPADPAEAALAAASALAREPDVERARNAAAAFWRKRGLSGRPKALIHPAPTAEQAAAIRHVFDITARPAEADLVLVLSVAGLDGLRALRGGADTALIPSADLSERPSPSCDSAFRIDDAETWSEVAAACLRFSGRRRSLSAARLQTPALRLLALLSVIDRPLPLRIGPGRAASCDYVTGLSGENLVEAVTSLARAGRVTCEPEGDRITARITELGARFLDGGETAEPPPPDAAPGPRADLERLHAESLGALLSSAEAAPDSAPLLNQGKIDELVELIGPDDARRLLLRLRARLGDSFGVGEADRAAVAREAHMLISMAGMLGCDRLSQACRSLERSAQGGNGPAPLLFEARALRDRTLAAIAAHPLMRRA